MGKRSSEYQRAFQASPTRVVDETYRINLQYRRSRRSAEMSHRVIDWTDENDENDVGAANKKAVEKKQPAGKDKREQKTQTPTGNKQRLETATQTPEKPTRDVSVDGEAAVHERESRSAAKRRAAKADSLQDSDRKQPRTVASKVNRSQLKREGKSESGIEGSDSELEIGKLNIKEQAEEEVKAAQKTPPKVDIITLLKNAKARPYGSSDSKHKRVGTKPHTSGAEGRPSPAAKPRHNRAVALFEVERKKSQDQKLKSKSVNNNMYLYGAADYSNGVAVKRTYNVKAPQVAVHETALRAAKRREAERANPKRRKRPNQRAVKSADADGSNAYVERSEFEKWMKRETSQWTTEYRSNFKTHDSSEYVKNREMASRCGVPHDDEDLIAVTLNPNYGVLKVGGHNSNHKGKASLNLPVSTRSASSRTTSARSFKSSTSASYRS